MDKDKTGYLHKMVRVYTESGDFPSGERIGWVKKVFPRKKQLQVVLALGRTYKIPFEAVKEVLKRPKPRYWGKKIWKRNRGESLWEK